MKKISILGVGFMGGSLALALKGKIPASRIYGYARSKKSLTKLKKLKILDKVETSLKTLVQDADIIILALPVKEIANYFTKIAPFLKADAIVMDLGSSKKYIEKQAKKSLPKNVDFVGCHPLCGSEKSGAEFSRASLYKDACCVITAAPSKKSTKIVRDLWKKLGSKVIFASADKHDKIIAFMSHLPHLLSFALIQSMPTVYSKFSTRSFKDLTRIAESSPGIWTDIFISNRENILKDLKRLNQSLSKFQMLLSKKDDKNINSLIKRINLKRKEIL